jgi:hypothetical protein
MVETHACPSCHESVDDAALVCPHCGAELPTPVPALKENPLAQHTEPLPALPSGHVPLGIHVTVNNDNVPLTPVKPPPTRSHATPWWWILAFVTLGIILILGSIFLLAHQPAPTAAVHPTPTAQPTPIPTPTAIPQAHVVVQLENVMCVTTRNFFRADGFYIKSSISAPDVNGQTITKNKTTNHYNVNDNETADFNAADQVVFDANVPLGGVVTGSFTAYTDNDTNALGTTNLKFSANDSTHSVTWHIQGRSFLNTWEHYVHYTISINPVAATLPSSGADSLQGSSSGAAGGLALDAPAARRWNA